MRLLIVRHGETTGNKKKILVGQLNDKLTRLGKQQAVKLAERLAKERIDIIYCSDLRRCKQTIQPLLKIKKIPIVYTKELRERNIGIFAGKPVNEFLKWLKNKNEKSLKIRIPKGESLHEVKQRTLKFLNKILKKEKKRNVLLVTHSTAKRTILLNLLNKNDIKAYRKYRPSNTGVTIVHIKENGKHHIRLFNSTKHLEKKNQNV